MKSFILIAHISSTSALLPVSIGLFQLRKLSKELKLIWCLAIASGCSDAISLVLMAQRINTWPVSNAFLAIQFILLFLVFTSDRRNFFFLVIFFGFLCFAILNYAIIQTPIRFNSYTTYIGGLILIVAAIRFLHQVMREKPMERIQDLPMLWIAFGVQIYFAGTLFLFLFNNYLMSNQPGTHQAIWVLHNILNIAKNIFFAVALWKNYKYKISQL